MSDLSEFSLLELFQQEAELHLASLSDGLLRLEKKAYDAGTLESLMRAAHSLKGAARMVGVGSAETLAHHMEDYFVGLQKGTVGVTPATIDVMLRGCDQIRELAGLSEDGLVHVEAAEPAVLEALVGEIRECLNCPPQTEDATAPAELAAEVSEPTTASGGREKTLRMNADRLDTLLSLAGEVQVLTGWLGRYSHRLTNLRTTHIEFLRRMGTLNPTTAHDAARLLDLHALGVHFSQALSERLDDLATYERRINRVTTRLYDEVVAGRMRPFGDGVRDLPRRVRDLARSLGKEVELDLQGLDVQVDRDILERLEAPLSHLIRNALDHGVEAPDERLGVGKPRVANLSVRAYHRGGMLQVLVEDDGRGIDLDALRARLAKAGTVNPETLQVMSEEELLQFLFLPGFSMRTEVTAVSGRGVGLDAARSAAQEMGGLLQCDFWPGKGARFQFSLPITLSVVQCLLVEVAGQPFGLPLSRLDRVLRLQSDQVTQIEGRPVIAESLIGLVSAARILELEGDPSLSGEQGLSVVIMSNGRSRHGLVVDRFTGKQSLVVQRLDSRLGKVQHVSSGAILEDGSAALVLDADDLFRSLERALEDRSLSAAAGDGGPGARKRVLVVDDSITVREVERNVLEIMGLDVDVAVDGMDGWHSVRHNHYDLVVSDIDMPRMDGIELVTLIKENPTLRHIPVILVSYKDREEDRMRGLAAGADYYMSKGNFQDDTFRQAVMDLLGHEPEPTT